MTANALPISFRAERDLFKNPDTGKIAIRKISAEERPDLCDEPRSLSSDFNGDGVDDFLVELEPEMLKTDGQIYLRDGRDKPIFAKVFDAADFSPNEHLWNIPASQGSLCVADFNGDQWPDIFWREGVLINQMPAWQADAYQKIPSDFRDDWIYLVKRLEAYRRKFGVSVKPKLFVEVENGGEEGSKAKFWQLRLAADGREFSISRFPDPIQNDYEPGSLLGREDPEEILQQRLFGRAWGLALRFGAFLPYTFRVEENTSPIGYVAGVEGSYRWRQTGLALEYDRGQAGVFPEQLRKVEAGDSISELPINEHLPMTLSFHNVSAVPFLHASFFGASFLTDLLGGAGAFYEWGRVKKKKFTIVPNLADVNQSFVAVDKITENYQSAGVRGRLGAFLARGAFQGGLEVLFDFGFPLDKEFKDFDHYLLRGILALSLGYRQPNALK